MAAFVGSYCGCGYGIAVVHAFGKVDGAVGGVVVVGEVTGYAGDAHVINAVVVQHFFSYFASGHARGKAYLRVFFEL